MKVKVVYTRTEKYPDKDWSDDLNIGDEFVVYAIVYQNSLLYYKILLNCVILSVPSEIFEIIDSRCSMSWEVFSEFKNNQIELFTIGPKLFMQEYFYCKFADDDKDAIEKFRSLQADMYREFQYEELIAF